MKYLLIVCTFWMGSFLSAQVGVGTDKPEGVLHIQNTNRPLGMVLPRVSSATSTVGVSSSTALEGTMVYDNARNCIRFLKASNTWSGCLIDSATSSRSSSTAQRSANDTVVEKNAQGVQPPLSEK